MLEETTANAAIAQLLTEGRSVTGPDRVVEGVGPSPDFVVDGTLVTLEVKRFINVQAAEAEAGSPQRPRGSTRL